jgi:hypothetical protein
VRACADVRAVPAADLGDIEDEEFREFQTQTFFRAVVECMSS